MKKIFVVLVAMICFGLSANADNGKTCIVKNDVGGAIGYVTAWIDDDGFLQVSNDTKNRVTVTVKYGCRGYQYEVRIVVPASETTIGKAGLKSCTVISVENPICN